MNIPGAIPLGDMTVCPGHYPAKLLKALAVIADRLHAEYGKQPWIANPDKSKESCVLASLAVRDFLRGIGFDAEVRSVCAIMKAVDACGRELHSAGVGASNKAYGRKYPDREPDGRWNGHLVVVLPREKVLIDTTLFPLVDRPAWSDLMTGMIALPTQPPSDERLYGLRLITGLNMINEDDGREFSIAWLDRPANVSWRRKGHDADRWRRRAVVDTLIAAFAWDENKKARV
jgi:hypothetical protein